MKTVYIHNFATISAQQRSSLAQVSIDHDGWEILQCLTSIIEPFELATRSLCAQQYPTLSLVNTTIQILRYGLSSTEKDSPYIVLFKRSLLKEFELYFDQKTTKQQKAMMRVSLCGWSTKMEIVAEITVPFDRSMNNLLSTDSVRDGFFV